MVNYNLPSKQIDLPTVLIRMDVFLMLMQPQGFGLDASNFTGWNSMAYVMQKVTDDHYVTFALKKKIYAKVMQQVRNQTKAIRKGQSYSQE